MQLIFHNFLKNFVLYFILKITPLKQSLHVPVFTAVLFFQNLWVFCLCFYCFCIIHLLKKEAYKINSELYLCFFFTYQCFIFPLYLHSLLILRLFGIMSLDYIQILLAQNYQQIIFCQCAMFHDLEPVLTLQHWLFMQLLMNIS